MQCKEVPAGYVFILGDEKFLKIQVRPGTPRRKKVNAVNLVNFICYSIDESAEVNMVGSITFLTGCFLWELEKWAKVYQNR
jgi:hypothetical protein